MLISLYILNNNNNNNNVLWGYKKQLIRKHVMTEQLKQKSASKDSIVTSSFINREIRYPETSLE
jgi:hypothetical protein